MEGINPQIAVSFLLTAPQPCSPAKAKDLRAKVKWI